MRKSREILSLRRKADGIFEIYADGELVEEYAANEDTWGALLPIKLWRHFNNIVEKRTALLGSNPPPVTK